MALWTRLRKIIRQVATTTSTQEETPTRQSKYMVLLYPSMTSFFARPQVHERRLQHYQQPLLEDFYPHPHPPRFACLVVSFFLFRHQSMLLQESRRWSQRRLANYP